MFRGSEDDDGGFWNMGVAMFSFKLLNTNQYVYLQIIVFKLRITVFFLNSLICSDKLENKWSTIFSVQNGIFGWFSAHHHISLFY